MPTNSTLERFEPKPFSRALTSDFFKVSWLFFKANQRKFGYDAGYIKDQYGCNLSKCKCAPFDQTVIGKFEF